MTEDPTTNNHPLARLSRKLAEREERRHRQDERWQAGFWAGVRMFGRVGWSIVVPGLIGTVLGTWLDSVQPITVSWSLIGLAGGVLFGCASAWAWLAREQRDLSRSAGKEEKNA